MDKITATAETLMRQASITADEYLRDAIDKIDNRFGEGFAHDHPELVGDFIKTCAIDYMAAALTASLQEIAEAVSRD